jgi:hypothetical protein
MLAQALHLDGQHREAQLLIARILLYSDRIALDRSLFPSARHDPRVTARIILARILWLQGQPEAAERIVCETLALAKGQSNFLHGFVLAYAAIPISLWRGDLAGASARIASLLECSADGQSLALWHSWGRCYDKLVGFHEQGPPEDEELEETFSEATLTPPELDHVATTYDGAVFASTIARAEAGLSAWCAPEVLRSFAERELRLGNMTVEIAEASFQRALALARAQGALSWELRAATSLARAWGHQQKQQEAIALLTDVLRRFGEGFADKDYLIANAALKGAIALVAAGAAV